MAACDIELAIGIALDAHEGQTDKGGAPYILHPLRIMAAMETDDERIVAVLHDVVEDSDWTLDELREQGFSETVVEAIDCLTRRDGETYRAFINRVALNPLATRVKLADLNDNMNEDRLGREPSSKDLERMQRYHNARIILWGAPPPAT